MAKAWEGCGGAGSLEAELTCPICLGLYRDPVSLNCGHSFCRQCIKNMLGAQQHSQGPYTCPMCRIHLGPTVELQNNFQLGNIVEAFQASASKRQEDEGSEKGKTRVVPCEYCLDGFQEAVKTCVVCNVSLCQAHLSKHNAKASQQEHILVEVGAGEAEERRCPEHGKLLECYCQEEEKCICVLCSIAGAHKGHEVITMKEERDKQLVKLPGTMTELQDSKSDLDTALEELQKCENQIKTNTKAVTSQLEAQLKDMRTQLVQKEKKILRCIKTIEENQLADIAKARKKMEQKRDQAEQNLQALQKIKEQPDIFLFLKELKLVTDRIASLDLDTERVDVEEVQLDQSMITQCQTLREKLMLQLDSLLQDVCVKLANQMELRSRTSATNTRLPEKDPLELLRQTIRKQQHLLNQKCKK
ncbi:E3 ubiquitin-protein ligase Midline-1-like isoform X3 [Corvus cornix cornix]|uniref:E3 ubiquitin-protein ligase Midline-1-like isoform X2 n=1 Tax=Corvus cornix cornix TaxID=932674 RepID=UPI00194FB260|nr:E3 ubiquitin-protein ligase Midline-1-like isoform X2 [Corvus cornix cornix]XP_039415698.1 E3 ubiquitin-protein ligase Midline-1-like isoform X3 [Corvus cornix cornix]